MLYLVTGGTGFIGPHLIKKLLSNGDRCRCLVRERSKTEGLEQLGVELVKGDITRADTLRGIADGVDGLFHMATLGHMSNFKVTEAMFESVNVQGTVNIMKECMESGIKKIVHCSTVAVMGICTDIPANEQSQCTPHHPYGRSKLRAEEMVLNMVSKSNLPATLIRFSMVYGPGDWRDLLKLTRIAKKGLFPKIGSRPKLTPLIHVDDAVQGLLLAMETGRVGEIYLITNPQSQPFDEIISILQGALGVSSIPLYIPTWLALATASMTESLFRILGKAPPITRKNIESTLADRVFSIEKAKKELGFSPKVDPKEGLRETVSWYKDHGWI